MCTLLHSCFTSCLIRDGSLLCKCNYTLCHHLKSLLHATDIWHAIFFLSKVHVLPWIRPAGLHKQDCQTLLRTISYYLIITAIKYMYVFIFVNKHTNEYSSTTDKLKNIVIDNKSAKRKNHCVATDVFSIFYVCYLHLYTYCITVQLQVEILCTWVMKFHGFLHVVTIGCKWYSVVPRSIVVVVC